MTKIFWDSMLFIYLLQGNPTYRKRVTYLRQCSLDRGDELCTSALVLGEILAGLYREEASSDVEEVKELILQSGFQILPFDTRAADAFGRIRARYKKPSADSINLACAAVHGVDLFLTGDRALHKLTISGIKFIADLNADLF